MKVFLDSGAWIALFNKKDINHSSAANYYQKQKQKRSIFYTNDYVLAETYTRFIYDTHLKFAIKLKEKIQKAIAEQELTVFDVDSTIRELAWKELKRYSDHKLSFTDGTIVALFKHYNLDQIFTFDRHFNEINLPTNLVLQ